MSRPSSSLYRLALRCLVLILLLGQFGSAVSAAPAEEAISRPSSVSQAGGLTLSLSSTGIDQGVGTRLETPVPAPSMQAREAVSRPSPAPQASSLKLSLSSAGMDQGAGSHLEKPVAAPAAPPAVRQRPRSSLADVSDLTPPVVATENGVYYTTDIDDASPTWESLNDGLTTADDKNARSMWVETYLRPDWWTGSLWLGTASGIWGIQNPFGGGVWTQQLTREAFWEVASVGYTAITDTFAVVAIEGSPDRPGRMYALVHGRMNNGPYGYDQDNLWLVRTTNWFSSWTVVHIVGSFYGVSGVAALAVAPHSQGDVVYVGYGYGLGERVIRKSIDGGASFSTVFSEGIYNKSITDIDVPYVWTSPLLVEG